MKVNSSIFQVLVLSAKGGEQYTQEFRLSQDIVNKPADHVKLVGLQIVHKPTFSVHIKELSMKCVRSTNMALLVNQTI